ncbi:MAG: transcription elongation factor GreB [Pseudomonadales bacterium]
MAEKYYITPAGAKALRNELEYLWRDKRPAVTQVVSDAAALGDRSENADYIYGKKQLREIDKRIRYLSKRLDNLEVVERTPDDRNKVFFGAWIKLEDETGEMSIVRIVGSDELDLKKGWISLNSPMAKSLMGKRKGDDVRVTRPIGDLEMHIVDVRYESFETED